VPNIYKIPDIPLILAPMAGVTDFAFRELTRTAVPGCVDRFYTEMVSVKGLLNKNRASYRTLPKPHETTTVQLFGFDPADFPRAIEIAFACAPKTEGIDINAACPVRKVVRNGAGAALAKNLPTLRRILEVSEPLVHAEGRRLTLKIRKGWETDPNYLEIISMAMGCGVDAIALHGRTVEQGYSGMADVTVLDRIPEVERSRILWSGDIIDPGSLEKATRCPIAGVLIGRASIGNPWIFQELKNAIGGKPYTPPAAEERIRTIESHVALMEGEMRRERICGAFKKFVSGYTKGIPMARSARNRLLMSTELDELKKGLFALLYENENLIPVEEG
jgi:nifR3 family TIM-barrel protein